jgi:alpha-L-fucosidase
MKTKIILIILLVIFSNHVFSEGLFFQVNFNNGLSPDLPDDTMLAKKIENWQDLKFGLFMHWGAYSQWGIVESWSLCNEDRDWIRANRPEELHPDYCQYKKDYEDLQTTFNPLGFNPAKWVKAAKSAGMKYVIFTTKHHDGFCMFDTKQTDYKITSNKCPFHVNPKANVTKEIFNAFRSDGFMTGAYFSKPDWHSEYFWWPYYATQDRNANYDPLKYPERWKKFKDFTYRQMKELMTEYGPVDILWLDGGWVNPSRNNQDIDMPRIADMARDNQPGIIIVDRGQKGPYTNYLTPEQHVPEEPILSPWESCITMGNSWSYKPDDDYKPVSELIHMLVDIVAKGGNLLLNIGPGPHGDFDPVAYERLYGISAWMKVNDEAIYETKPVKPYKYENICLTQNKNTGAVYAIYLVKKNEKEMPSFIKIDGIKAAKNARLSLMGEKVNLRWENTESGIEIYIPERIRKEPPCEYAWTIKITGISD